MSNTDTTTAAPEAAVPTTRRAKGRAKENGAQSKARLLSEADAYGAALAALIEARNQGTGLTLLQIQSAIGQEETRYPSTLVRKTVTTLVKAKAVEAKLLERPGQAGRRPTLYYANENADKLCERVAKRTASAEKPRKVHPIVLRGEPARRKAGKRFAIGLEKWRGNALPTGAVQEFKQTISSLKIKPLSAPTPLVGDEKRVMWLFWAVLSVECMQHIINHHNEHNRAVGVSHAARYAEKMRGDNWAINGATIVLSDGADLLDGQNRLKGAIAVGEPLVAPICLGIPHIAFKTIDDTFVRTIVHRLQTAGRPFASVRAYALVLLHRLERSKIDKIDHFENMDALRFDGVSAFGLDEHYEKRLDPAIDFVHGLRWGIGSKAFAKHTAAFMLVILSDISPDAARNFIRLIVEGGADHHTAPAFVRERLMKAAQKTMTPAEAKRKIAQQIKLVANAWNSYAWHKAKTSHTFKSNAGESVVECITKGLQPVTSVALEEARAKTPPDMVYSIMERAAAIKRKNLDQQRAATSDRDGVAVMRIKTTLESR